jgi:hypothetical protein
VELIDRLGMRRDLLLYGMKIQNPPKLEQRPAGIL